VSAYISEFIFDKYHLNGTLYPSVRAQFKTYNLVLNPYISLRKLTFKNAAIFELFLNRKNALIDNVAYAEIDMNNKIYWNYTERTSEIILNKLL